MKVPEELGAGSRRGNQICENFHNIFSIPNYIIVKNFLRVKKIFSDNLFSLLEAYNCGKSVVFSKIF